MAKHATTLQSRFVRSLGIRADLGADHADAADSVLARMEEWGFGAAEVYTGIETDDERATPAIVCPSGPVTALIYANPLGRDLSALILGPDGRAVPVATDVHAESLADTLDTVADLMHESATLAETLADWLEPAVLYATC